MQVKVITSQKTYCFSQDGKVVDKMTEPYIKVEVDNKEDVEALYDAMQEHLSTAFTYSSTGEINGLTADYSNAIQEFLQVDNAWYLRDLEKADCAPDKTPTTVSVHEVIPASNLPAAPVKPVEAEDDQPEIQVFSGFIPSQNQREVLKELQDTAERLRRITPDPADKWQAQLQRQLNSVLYFGIDDVDKACAEGQEQVRILKEKADALDIPATVIALNEAPPTENPEEEDTI